MSTKDRREVADLVVIGGSVGGMVAAIDAADQGARVVIVEREKELGGSAGHSPEHMAIGGSWAQGSAGIADDPAGLVFDLEAETLHHLHRARAEAIAAAGPSLASWLTERLGLAVELAPGSNYRGHSKPRLHTLGGPGAKALLEALTTAVSKHHRIRVLPGIAASRLEAADGAVVGAELASRRRSDPTAVEGPVLLACGGHAADAEQVAAEAPDLADLPSRGAASATGDGLRMAREVGAHAEAVGEHLVTGLMAFPSERPLDPVLISLGAILVNQSGRRFVDETAEGVAVGLAVHAQPGHVAYLLFGEDIAERAAQTNPFLARVSLPGAVRRANYVGDLARQLEIDEEVLGRTVDTWNANVELGGDPLGRETSPTRLTPRYCCARVTASRWRSLGGIAVDADSRVLGVSGQPIPGLFATGGVVGGLSRGGPSDELPGIVTLIALASARLAVAAWAASRPAAD